MKFLSNLILQLTIFFVIFFSTIFFPLYFMLPILSPRNSVLLAILVTIAAILEIIGFIFICIETHIKPMRKINDMSKKLTLGDYNVRVNLKCVDRELKKLSLNINNIANEFENLEQMRRSFVSNASHELRSPLTSIQGFLQAMLDGTIADKDKNQYLEIVLSEAKRLNTLINSMLDLSRLESGANPLNLSNFDANSLINHVVRQFKPALAQKNISVTTNFAEEETRVYADKEKITQVLINLIDNAIKYSRNNSQISVGTDIHGRKLYVTVSDSGVGISKKEQLLIWDRFYMIDKARTPAKSKGTGLGLSIVKKIIEDHKEAIWVESSKGVGSTFIFTLSLYEKSDSQPRNKTAPEDDIVEQDKEKES